MLPDGRHYPLETGKRLSVHLLIDDDPVRVFMSIVSKRCVVGQVVIEPECEGKLTLPDNQRVWRNPWFQEGHHRQIGGPVVILKTRTYNPGYFHEAQKEQKSGDGIAGTWSRLPEVTGA